METGFSPTVRRDAVAGCLLGGAVGDAVGLAAEGLPRRRQAALFGSIDGPRLLPGHGGMYSDDTEHAILTARALIASGGEPDRFAREMASELRRWFLLLPAGVGLATLRACLRLLLGFGPERSGVASAGNGPAMRASLLGVCYGDDPDRLRALVRASTRITHTDRRAEDGALAVAVAAHRFSVGATDSVGLLRALTPLLEGTALLAEIDAVVASVAAGEATVSYAERRLGAVSGVSGYVLHTVPAALHAALSHPGDLRAAVLSMVACGGDTDTTAAIVGGIVGAGVRSEGVPAEWRAALREWPQGVDYMARLSAALTDAVIAGKPVRPPRPALAAIALRNLAFLAVVLLHGLRRLLPPY